MFPPPPFIRVLCLVLFSLVPNLPPAVVPGGDQGVLRVYTLLPDAASLERTDAVMKKAEAVLAKHQAVDGYNAISGFSLLTGAYSSNMGFFFVQLKEWSHRGREQTAAIVTQELNQLFAQEI